MLHPRTIDDVIAGFKTEANADQRKHIQQLRAPAFKPDNNHRSWVALGVKSMQDHMTDEGWQITHGLEYNGYKHTGYGLPYNMTDISKIILNLDPSVMVIQDKREWSFTPDNFRDSNARFTNISSLRNTQEIFKLTILKDAQQNPGWHSTSCEQMDIHAWIIYYHPRIVTALAPYVRPQHLIRTYHTLDHEVVPTFNHHRDGCLFSGAISNAYPLRQRISKAIGLPITTLVHPGYHRKGCNTPEFLNILSNFKVSICTSSRYGYALRKIIESTACGCRVITDLPVDEVLPGIDANLIRIHPEIEMDELRQVINEAVSAYDIDIQREHALNAIRFYDYRRMTRLLACDIELLRSSYND